MAKDKTTHPEVTLTLAPKKQTAPMESIIHHPRRSDITFFRGGRIDITARVARMLALAPGDIINIAEHLGEFYLYVMIRAGDACGRYEATCHPTKQRSRNFRAHSARLCHAMIRTAHPCARFPVGPPVHVQPIGLCVPIITLNPIAQ